MAAASVVTVAAMATAAATAMATAALPAPSVAGVATLSVEDGDSWREFWRSDRAPTRWSAPDSTFGRALTWRPLAPGLEWAELRLGCAAPLWRAKVIFARLDLRFLDLTLQMDHTRKGMRPSWSIDRAPRDALLAVNAGQFVGAMPWGWVVEKGRQRLAQGSGPLSSAVAIDRAGNVRWTHGGSVPATDGVSVGFQSYPTLLNGDGALPPALSDPAGGVNLTHRDIRLALGQTRDGRLLLAMTRYDAMGKAASAVPLGPTTPEMAAIMGALGARDAVMLDGGISAQLLLREAPGQEPLEWRGWRNVPLGLIARARAPHGMK
jgi:hypothetical protein